MSCPDKTARLTIATIVAYGMGTVVTQLILTQEFLNFYSANELTIGIVLFVWMSLVALGSWAGKYISQRTMAERLFYPAMAGMGLFPVISLIMLRYLRLLLSYPGESVSLNQIVFAACAGLFAFCFLSGIFFIILSKKCENTLKSNVLNRIYYIETAGSVAGGLLFTFILTFHFSPFEVLRLVALLNFSCLLLFALFYKRKIWFTCSLLMILIISLSYYVNLDIITKRGFFVKQDIIKDLETPYGNLVVTRTGEQLNFYQSGMPEYATGDMALAEEKVHYALLRHKAPRNVLLISGGITGTLLELSKYKDVETDYAEMNPFMLDMARKYRLIPDKNVNIIAKDPIIHLKQSSEKYDVIITDMPEPSSAQTNRFYTLAYYRLLSNHLNTNGIISTALGSTAQYMNSEARLLHSVIFNTLSAVYKNVIILPGGKNFFLASDTVLGYGIAEGYALKNISTKYVNPYYIDDADMAARGRKIVAELDRDAPVNTVLKPVAYKLQNNYWMSRSGGGYTLVVPLILIILLVVFTRFNSLNFCLFIAGFTGCGSEMLMLIIFQAFYGYVYNSLGLMVAVFMGGIATGAWLGGRFKASRKKLSMVVIQGLIAVTLLICALIIPLFQHLNSPLIVQLLIYAIAFIISLLTGSTFGLATLFVTESGTSLGSSLYSSDMAGSALGALLVAVLLIPLAGITHTLFLMALLNLLSGSFLWISKSRQ